MRCSWMNNIRIVERTNLGGILTYVVQERHFLLKFLWVDASINYENARDTFNTYQDAENYIKTRINGKVPDRVVDAWKIK